MARGDQTLRQWRIFMTLMSHARYGVTQKQLLDEIQDQGIKGKGKRTLQRDLQVLEHEGSVFIFCLGISCKNAGLAFIKSPIAMLLNMRGGCEVKKVFVLLITMLLISFNFAMVDGEEDWGTTLNEYLSEITNLACIEKKSPHLKECSIPMNKCKRFATLVSKNCLGQAIKSKIKHPRNMTQEEFLTVLDEAGICAGRTIPLITYYVCPELHERSWAGKGSFWREEFER